VGDNGADVEALQRGLNSRLGLEPPLDVDGDFGPATAEALRRFQRSRGLDPTGVADARTWESLGPIPAAGEADVPPPEVVNSQPDNRRPPELLTGPPFVSSKVWVVLNARTGAVLAGKDESKAVDMASTTKVMTALVALRRAKVEPALLDETVVFSERADKTTGSTAGVRAGERLPLRDLLYGLLLPSGNDASVAIGEHVGRRLPDETTDDPLDRFIAEMNRTAAELGLSETHYANTHGLTAAGHHTSPRDLARLSRVALDEPVFARCVNTARRGCVLTDAEGHTRNVVWKNTNRLLDTEGYDGVKTGTTGAAGS
jgi:D-alanyl-D-alanine carboxypeptidase (penicillin-binding protein 5/6)